MSDAGFPETNKGFLTYLQIHLPEVVVVGVVG